MQSQVLRNAGIAVGAAALAGALALATMNGEPQAPPAETSGPEKAGPLPVAPPVAEAPASTDADIPPPDEFETASAQAPPPAPPPAMAQNVSFIVRFQGNGPLGRAQALAGQGREADARRTAEAALASQRSLRGLCLDRFTVGGAEMVLRLCTALPAGEQASARDRWLTRLRAIPAVAYAENNAIADPGRR